MSRYIDADALMNQWCDEMCKPKPSCEEDCAVYDYVRLAPSIDIVPCKECRYCKKKRGTFKGEPIIFYRCTENNRDVESDDFCAYGQKERASDGSI